MAELCRRHQVEVWAYCLMPNHIHLIAVPFAEDGLRCAIGEAHKRYTLRINKRQKWSGHLWQGRFFSYPMDDHHMLMAVRYVELNPVRKGIVEHPEDYLWSSARAHLNGTSDVLVNASPLTQMVQDWQGFLSLGLEEADMDRIRIHEGTGRPLGGDRFITRLENETGRILRPRKAGRKPQAEDSQLKIR